MTLAIGPLLCAIGLVLEVIAHSTPGIVFCACCFVLALVITAVSW